LVIGAAVAFGAAQMAAGVMPTYLAFAAVCPVIGWIGGLMVIVGAGLASTLLLRTNARRAAPAAGRSQGPADDMAAASPAARR
jgi:hypothetical protein